MKVIAKAPMEYIHRQLEFQEFNYFDLITLDLASLSSIETNIRDSKPVMLDTRGLTQDVSNRAINYLKHFVSERFESSGLYIIGDQNYPVLPGDYIKAVTIVQAESTSFFNIMESLGLLEMAHQTGCSIAKPKHYLILSGLKDPQTFKTLIKCLTKLHQMVEGNEQIPGLNILRSKELKFILDGAPEVSLLQLLTPELRQYVDYVLTDIPAVEAMYNKRVSSSSTRPQDPVDYKTVYNSKTNMVFTNNVKAMQKLCDGLELETGDFV